MKTFRWIIEQKLRILVFVKLITIEGHIGQDFSLLHDVQILLGRGGKVKKEQTHQDEGDD
ncbi:MAG: hypothetical protein J6W30_08780 [Bacteroidales bacterium]|nr:hypothetical protein [Bacteroidales bacterium]